jgi:hypothetical protein
MVPAHANSKSAKAVPNEKNSIANEESEGRAKLFDFTPVYVKSPNLKSYRCEKEKTVR